MDGLNYWTAGRRVREPWARAELAHLLALAETVTSVEHAAAPMTDVRRELTRLAASVTETRQALTQLASSTTNVQQELMTACTTIRALAQAVARGEATPPLPLAVQVSLPSQRRDAEGRPRWSLSMSLADALTWMAVKLLAEVPRSLVRPCGFSGCARVYVATRNQRFCPSHQAEARRQTQRRAMAAFRTRQRTTTTRRIRR
jgi:hypothetical protein